MRSKSDKGFSFAIVVIVIMVTSFIVMACIVIANANYKMKETKSKAVDVYYKAEDGINKIRAEIEVLCATDIQDSYTIVLKSASTIPTSQLDNEFKRVYTDMLYKTLTDTDLLARFQGYFPSGGNIECVGVGSVIPDTANYKVTIEDIVVKYTDNDTHFENTVQTDIVMKAPEVFGDYSKRTNVADAYAEYVLVADEGICFEGNQDIWGSVYAGAADLDDRYKSGISIGYSSGGTVSLHGRNIITRGNITAYTQSALNINGIGSDNAHIYGLNIKTEQGTRSFENIEPNKKINVSLTFNGDTYMKENVLLSQPSSNVLMSGSYYGYTPVTSSFCINASDVNVDLTGLNTFWLAGTSYIDIPVAEGSTSVIMGESLTGKQTQSMYLVPSCCIYDSTTHEPLSNPIDVSKYHILNSGVTCSDASCSLKHCYVDLSKNKEYGGIDLLEYCDSSNAFKPVLVNYRAGSSLDNNKRSYLYLNIRSEKVSDYSALFSNLYPNYVTNRAKSFNLGNISIGSGSLIRTVGSVLTFDGETASIVRSSMPANSDYIDTRNKYIDNKYISLKSTLEENKSSEENSSCFEHVINIRAIEGKVDSSLSGAADWFKCNDVVKYSTIYDADDDETLEFLVADGDVKIQKSFKGVVITTGNVEFVQPCNVVGTIFSGGTIDFNNALGSTVKALEGDIKPLAWLLTRYENRDDIKIYFNELKNDITGNVIDSLDLRTFITYKNWVVK